MVNRIETFMKVCFNCNHKMFFNCKYMINYEIRDIPL